MAFYFRMEVMAIDRHRQIVDELTTDAIKLMSDWPSSREKQKQFVLAYVSSGFKNATEAARQAELQRQQELQQMMQNPEQIRQVFKSVGTVISNVFTTLSVAFAIREGESISKTRLRNYRELQKP